MTHSEARAHLAKAREFLAAAVASLEAEQFNAATSSAVICGINSKDAICLRLTGRTRKPDSHHEAVTELRSAGPPGAMLAPTLGRLLRLKTKSQYQSASIAMGDAARAVEWATRLLENAEEIVSIR
ncbi:HEPN domain-containing protein [Microbacterium sp.]|uniref:HEPN domain-containing protein n=1 Tax=Microbacterium sp. TaxID=51671 RepID=UPI00373704A7